jgi:peptidoglycan-associated lipoprotein
VKVTVNLPPPPVKPRQNPTLSQRLFGDVVDAYFDFDKSNIRQDARETLIVDASALNAILKDFPDATIIVEGHCDERGSAEYNLALGDRRAAVTRDFLQQLGVAANRLSIVSFGKERPQCTEATEKCWQKNRRVHFSPGRSGPPVPTTTSQRIP